MRPLKVQMTNLTYQSKIPILIATSFARLLKVTLISTKAVVEFEP
jgi:hypothetical protein